MPITVEAVFENGVLRPVQALPLQEHEKVQITIQQRTSWVKETFGLLGWKGDREAADFFACDAELDFPPPKVGP